MIFSKIRTYSLSDAEKEACLNRVARILQERPELNFVYAYGSFLDSGPFRDLDIALFLNNERIPTRINEYEADLERLLSKTLNIAFPIEVRVLNAASIPLLKAVIQGRLLVDNLPDRRIDFVTIIIARYLDIEPVLRHHAREAHADEVKP